MTIMGPLFPAMVSMVTVSDVCHWGIWATLTLSSPQFRKHGVITIYKWGSREAGKPESPSP